MYDTIVIGMKNYFIPNEANEYNPHIFKPQKMLILFVIALLIAVVSSIGAVVVQNSSLLASIQSAFLVDLTNKGRADQSIGTLGVNPILIEAAQQKANDMAKKSYFAHTSPEGKTPWHWFSVAGYEYLYAGENLAVNFTESVDVHRAWIASPTHKQNIMDKRFTEIGIASAEGFYKGRKATFVVQMFGKPRVPFIPKISQVVPLTSQVGVAIETIPVFTSVPDEVTKNIVTEVEGAQTTFQEAEVSVFASQTNFFQRLLVSPLLVGQTILLIIIAILAVTLSIRLVFEFKKHHMWHTVILSLIICALCLVVYTQQNLLFNKTIVDGIHQENTSF